MIESAVQNKSGKSIFGPLTVKVIGQKKEIGSGIK